MTARTRWFIPLMVLICLAAGLPAGAVMPPRVYEQRAMESKIKAVAMVESMREVDRDNHARQLMLTFRLVKNLPGSKAPEAFTGHCWTLLPGGEPMPGGRIYYRVQQGQRVFVTIAQDSGMITTFAPMSPELEAALAHDPPRIKYGMGGVQIIQ